MDKKKLPSLDELLNQVRHSESVMQQEEAITWLNAQKELPLHKHHSKTTKTLIMTSIISFLGIILLFWMNTPIGQQPTVDSLQSSVNGRQSTGNGEQFIADSPRSMVHGQQSTVNGPQFKNKSSFGFNESGLQQRVNSSEPSADVSLANNLAGEPLMTSDEGRAPIFPLGIVGNPPNVFFDGMNQADTPRVDTMRVIRIEENMRQGDKEGSGMEHEFVFDIQIDTGNGLPCGTDVNALTLSTEELKKLGIVSDQGSLLYQQDHTQKGQLKLVFQGMMMSKYTSTLSGLSHHVAPDILPLAIMNCKGVFQYPNQNKPDSVQLEAALAVRVPVNNGDEYLLFWFPRNKDIMDLLPSWAKEEIHHSDILYHQKPLTAQKNPGPLRAKIQLQKLYWEPEETTILLGDRAKKLGLKVDESGFHFKRDRRRVDITKDWHRVSLDSKLSEKEQFEETRVKKLQPFYVSSDHFYQGMPTSQLSALNEGTYESFTFDKFRLVALKVEHPELGSYLFWYPYSPALKSLLTPEERERVEAKLSKIDPAVRFDPKRTKYEKWEDLFVDETPVTDALNAVQPSLSILNKLGVKITEQGGIEVNNLYENNTMLVFEFSKTGTRFNDLTVAPNLDSLTRNNLLEATKALVSITDDLGLMPRMFLDDAKDYQMNELIPVLVRSGKTFTLNDKINQHWRPDIILWFKPTKEVLSILESEGMGAVWEELGSTEIEDTSSANCKYTEVCRNKPGVFNSPLLYPNPASGFAHFSWIATEPSAYSIKLYALNGAEVKAYSNLHSTEGKNQYTLDLDALPPGIYMMILTSEKGDEMHERLVIRE